MHYQSRKHKQPHHYMWTPCTTLYFKLVSCTGFPFSNCLTQLSDILMAYPTKLPLQAAREWQTHICARKHPHKHRYRETTDNRRLRGRDEKRENGVHWFSVHRSRKILAWEDMRIWNVDDYSCPRKIKVCLCVLICASAREGLGEESSADRKTRLRRTTSLFAFGGKFERLNLLI